MNRLPEPDQQASALRLPTPSNSHTLPLREAAAGLGKSRAGRLPVRTKDLVGYLLGHGARAWRSSMPIARSHVHARTPNGKLAVRIRLG